MCYLVYNTWNEYKKYFINKLNIIFISCEITFWTLICLQPPTICLEWGQTLFSLGCPLMDVCEQWRSQFEMDASRFVLEGSTKEPDETETSFRRRVCEGVSCCRCVVSLCLQNPPHWLLLIWRIDKKYIFGLGGNNRRSKYQPTMNFCLWESIFCTSQTWFCKRWGLEWESCVLQQALSIIITTIRHQREAVAASG